MRAIVICLMLVGVGDASAQQPPDLPGAAQVQAHCSTCHGEDLIAQQRLSRAGWGREIDKMVRWGAVVAAAEREPMLDYLAAHFAPKSGAAATTVSANRTYQRACLVCHGSDLIEGQRLNRAGWTREVEKMIRWGAAVPESEKTALIDALAARLKP
ncbi:MAG: hypothetical protein ABJC89_01120 [Acidobacteriota bacterium]